MAVYLVEGKEGTKDRLVETRTKAGAINHVSRNDYKATALNTSELVKHIKDGMEVETIEEAKTEPEPAQSKPEAVKKTETPSKKEAPKVAAKKAA